MLKKSSKNQNVNMSAALNKYDISNVSRFRLRLEERIPRLAWYMF